MAKQIIIKPLLTDKSNALAENPLLNQYTFVVALDANRIEIKNAVEKQFGVTVENVNVSIRPGKKRSRVIKGRQTSGRKAPVKKAYVTVKQGDIIEGYYGETESIEEVAQDDTNVVANA
jgi:large subunit ribosomal protein L23